MNDIHLYYGLHLFELNELIKGKIIMNQWDLKKLFGVYIIHPYFSFTLMYFHYILAKMAYTYYLKINMQDIHMDIYVKNVNNFFWRIGMLLVLT